LPIPLFLSCTRVFRQHESYYDLLRYILLRYPPIITRPKCQKLWREQDQERSSNNTSNNNKKNKQAVNNIAIEKSGHSRCSSPNSNVCIFTMNDISQAGREEKSKEALQNFLSNGFKRSDFSVYNFLQRAIHEGIIYLSSKLSCAQ
jgi:hypothetical protein